MAKSRKKTFSQHIVGLAAMTMPAPVRDVLVTRWGARLTLLSSAVLLGSGIISLQWNEGKPHVQLNRDRAAEVTTKVEQRIEEVQKQHSGEKRITDRWGFGEKMR